MIPSPDRTLWIARHILPHEPALRAWLARRVIAGLEIDDVVQETYVAMANLVSVAHVAAPRAYAFQVAQSVILRHIRRLRIVPMTSLDDMGADATAVDEPSPEQHTHGRRELQRLMALIGKLPAKCRETFMLRKIEGLSQHEVARRMGISESTVEKHMTKALHSLMAAFRQGVEIDPETALQEGDPASPRP